MRILGHWDVVGVVAVEPCPETLDEGDDFGWLGHGQLIEMPELVTIRP